MQTKKGGLFSFLIIVLGIFIVFPSEALAVCPICTVAVGAGLGLSRWLGIDDSVTGLWIGGLIVSMITWTLNWLEKKNIRFKGRAIATVLVYYLLIGGSLFYSGIIMSPLHSLCACGLDKLSLSIIVGSVSFWFGASWYDYLKEKNQGRAYFPFQKVVMPLVPLIIISIIFYFLTK